MLKLKSNIKYRNLSMHSCWGLFYFVLRDFGLKLIVFKILFGKCFGIEIRKKKRRKNNKGEKPLGKPGRGPASPAPSLSNSRVMNTAQPFRPKRPHSSPLSFPAFGPHPSALPPSPPISLPRWPHPSAASLSPTSSRVRVGDKSCRTRSHESRDFLALFANQDPIKLLLQSRSFRLHLSRKNVP